MVTSRNLFHWGTFPPNHNGAANNDDQQNNDKRDIHLSLSLGF